MNHLMKLENLTLEQKQMMERIWAFESEGDFLIWFSELTYLQKCTAESLLILLQHEFMEGFLGDSKFAESKEILSKFRLL
jgi:hypothetical protein